MLFPEGQSAPSSSTQVPGPQQAEVVGQPAALVKVSVPTGAVAGQQINFTMPNGQRVSTSVQEQIQPGALLTVSVPSAAPATAPATAPAPAPQPSVAQPPMVQAREALLPQPTVVNALEADRHSSQCSWIVFGLSFAACCCIPGVGLFVALIAWSGVALTHFCKPREDRLRHPRTYAPACASAVTAGALCFCGLMALVTFLVALSLCGPGAWDPDSHELKDACPGLERWVNRTHHHGHGQWHGHFMLFGHHGHHFHHWGHDHNGEMHGHHWRHHHNWGYDDNGEMKGHRHHPWDNVVDADGVPPVKAGKFFGFPMPVPPEDEVMPMVELDEPTGEVVADAVEDRPMESEPENSFAAAAAAGAFGAKPEDDPQARPVLF
mmetsp:Transcript_33577/g.62918  ORF Transcript_33577/g.62918 Transcript_33577/m.62918 type:complete len:378 (-) Transcript_33577:85-1218(-)